MNKKAYFFSIDSFIALIIILGVILFIKPVVVETNQEVNVQEDLLNILSSVKIGEINNSYAKQLINQGNITNLNQSVLEQIGEFYANSDAEAVNLAQNILNDLDLKENIGLYFNNVEIAKVGTNPANAEKIKTSRQIISGIQQGNTTKGYSSRAFLFSKNKVDYFYFGGYVGDGNITINLGENANSIKVEAIFSNNFTVSLNGNAPLNYNPSPQIPFEFSLTNGFVQGENVLYFTSDSNLYIAGGYIKINYNDSETFETTKKFKLPGIGGFINLYDSFFIPGNLSSMNIFLNYSSLYNIFLTIGNKTIYWGNGTNVQNTIDNTQLSTLLDYSTLTDKTIPFRLGLENISYILNISMDADVFSITDLSGSMDDDLICSGGESSCCFWWFFDMCQGNLNRCESCGGTASGKIISAKEANKVFIDEVLKDDDNRVGLIGYSTGIDINDYHPLSQNNVSLKSKVDEWDVIGNTCICCGINEGVTRMNLESDETKFRSLVVMTDGQANIECDLQGNTPDLNGNGQADDAGDDAIQAACDAAAQGIKVYSVAFGTDADINTTQAMGSCGEGGFYYGTVEDLVKIYEDIAEEIIEAAYYEQTVIGEGFFTELYPSSYISINYEKEIPYGLILTAETPIFGNNLSIGNLTIPNDTIPYEVKAVSYSGSKWTDKVKIYDFVSSNWENIFDLTLYGRDYVELGDPYAINIPLNKINYGNNSIKVSTSLGQANSSGGSPYNKIIYSLIKDISAYSQIVASAEGCIWTIEFEDGTNSTMTLPPSYSGSNNCFYTSSNIAYNNNDAINNAIYNLLTSLDLNSNGKVETKFTEADLTIDSSVIDGIPFTWETEVQARSWR